MPYKDFSAWFLSGVVSLLVVILGWLGTQSLDELRNIRKEVTDLNLKMVAVISNQTSQQMQIDELKKRVEKVEETK
jgi:uncharacterized membrane protein